MNLMLVAGSSQVARGHVFSRKYPVQEGVEILFVAFCFQNRDKLRPDGTLASNGEFTSTFFHVQIFRAVRKHHSPSNNMIAVVTLWVLVHLHYTKVGQLVYRKFLHPPDPCCKYNSSLLQFVFDAG